MVVASEVHEFTFSLLSPFLSKRLVHTARMLPCMCPNNLDCHDTTVKTPQALILLTGSTLESKHRNSLHLQLCMYDINHVNHAASIQKKPYKRVPVHSWPHPCAHSSITVVGVQTQHVGAFLAQETPGIKTYTSFSYSFVDNGHPYKKRLPQTGR